MKPKFPLHFPTWLFVGGPNPPVPFSMSELVQVKKYFRSASEMLTRPIEVYRTHKRWRELAKEALEDIEEEKRLKLFFEASKVIQANPILRRHFLKLNRIPTDKEVKRIVLGYRLGFIKEW